MLVEIKVPTPGESITSVELGKWLVEDGEVVEKDQELGEVESDKATLTLVATESGKISLKAQEGETISVGTVACTIDPSVVPAEKQKGDNPGVKKEEVKKDSSSVENETKEIKQPDGNDANIKVTSVARKMMEEYHLSMEDVLRGLHRISKRDVEAVLQERSTNAVKPNKDFSREEQREKMSALRRKLSERLVSVKNETAMLTTFNEVDMSNVLALRKAYQNKFIEKHGFKLGFMAFFTKAVAEAIKFHPTINSQIDGDDIVTPDYVDVGIAVQTPKGLIVPIIRSCESKSVPTIEAEIKELAEKARNKKISVSELTGGTFTITNGGTFGSLLSTPIINPPQSAILGMHNIQERPVAVDGKVEIKPMMYLALSYDHRIIDGKDSVGFLVKVKELIEHPERIISGGRHPGEILLEL